MVEVGPDVEFSRYPHLGWFQSSFGSRIGPQPAWASPVAIMKYVLHPHGLSREVRRAELGEATRRDHAEYAEPLAQLATLPPLDFGADARVSRLLRIADGEFIEVEQWGGWAMSNCPPICGLWANIWSGTGIAMRVRQPYASLNKATAVAGMIQRLGARSPSALQQLAEALHVQERAAALCGRFVATHAACVATALLRIEHPCPRAGGAGKLRSTMRAA